ncbi:hypothetical protein DCAR_0521711 [Daucus carota subsp. sativus]|uniref:DUF4216 domain-containing protein n=1 Tax=Daucus carota subsp. sativus TaxID=79200 RepID=A0AAF0X8C0_DAUCS|nr:hypothetical protein DCAR_0521711 [Daucus carota subsp. sativus]
MYPFERFLCILKAYVRNRRLPEASIVEGYTIEETIGFCTDYLASTDRVGIPISRHEGRLQGQGTLGHKMISPSAEMLDRAHLFVLQHMTDVHSYLQEHLFDIQKNHPSKSGKWRGVRVDDSGFTLVDFVRFGHEDDPFIFATQVNQVFYIRDPADPKWSIVLQSKRCIVGIDNVEDEEEYNQFDDNPPFSIGIQTTTLREDNVDINYARNDHDEGVWIEDPIANLENLESLDSSILSSDRSSRSYDWVRARTKKKEDGSYYIPNSQTKEVFDKMVNYLILRFIKL